MSPAELLEWMQFAPLIGIALLILGVLVWLIRKVLPVMRRFNRFLDDFFGEPARPGFEGRPGVMERLAGFDTSIAEVRHEVMFNHGSSLKDAVHRVEAQVTTFGGRLDAHLAASGSSPVVTVVTHKED